MGTTSTNVESAIKNIELEVVEKTPASIRNETAKTPNIDPAQYQPPSRPDTPTNMEDAETQYNLEDLNVIQKPKKKPVEKKATPKAQERWCRWKISRFGSYRA